MDTSPPRQAGCDGNMACKWGGCLCKNSATDRKRARARDVNHIRQEIAQIHLAANVI